MASKISREEVISLNFLLEWASFHCFDTIVSTTVEFMSENDCELSQGFKERSVFFKVLKLLNSASYSQKDSFVHILQAFDELANQFRNNAKAVDFEWDNIRKDIIKQIGICKLRESVHATDDDNSNFEIPEKFDYKKYCKVIPTLGQKYFPDDQEESATFVGLFTNNLLANRNQKTLSKKKTNDFCNDNNITNFKREVGNFLKSLQRGVLPIPRLEGSYVGVSVSHSSKPSSSSNSSGTTAAPASPTANTRSTRSANIAVVPSATSNSNRGKKTGKVSSSSKGEDITEAAVASDDFMDSSPDKHHHHHNHHHHSKHHESASKHRSSSNGFHKHHGNVNEVEVFKAVSSGFRDKYEQSDPLKDIINAVEHVESANKKRGSGAIQTHLVDSPVKKSARRDSEVRPLNIDEDSSESEDMDEVRPTLTSTFNKMKNAIGSANNNHKFPAKLDVASPTRRSSKQAPPLTQASPSVEPPSLRAAWTDLETEAFLAGVAKYGHGMWREILDDNQFGVILSRRTNINLKDRYRTLEKQGLVV